MNKKTKIGLIGLIGAGIIACGLFQDEIRKAGEYLWNYATENDDETEELVQADFRIPDFASFFDNRKDKGYGRGR